jgi:hypothetical protein
MALRLAPVPKPLPNAPYPLARSRLPVPTGRDNHFRIAGDSLRISRYVDDVAGALISGYRNRGRVARKRIVLFWGAGVFVY